MSRGIVSSLGVVALVVATATGACSEDENDSRSSAQAQPASTQRTAVTKVMRAWLDEKDCSLISISYAIRRGHGSVEDGRADCDSAYAYAGTRGPSRSRIDRVVITGDVATVSITTRHGRHLDYPLTRDGAGRWRIDGDAVRPDCLPAGRVARGMLSICGQATSDGMGSFVVTDAAGQRALLDISAPAGAGRAAGSVIGHWAWAAASPDGKTVLAQWSAECEIPFAYLVPADGGRPRLATGQATTSAAESIALGWTTDGRAIVFIPHSPGCGSGEGAGLYVIALDGTRTLLARATGFDPPGHLKRSIRARSVAALRAAIR